MLASENYWCTKSTFLRLNRNQPQGNKNTFFLNQKLLSRGKTDNDTFKNKNETNPPKKVTKHSIETIRLNNKQTSPFSENKMQKYIKQ